jgi:NTP pyrophosphatase (non-canonical NTP hydrolase)
MANLSKLQEEVLAYDQKYGWEGDKESHIALHMTEELGEISRLILRLEGYKHEEYSKKALAEELIDLLYLTIKLGNTAGIDLEKEWYSAFERYEKKTSRKELKK